MKSKNSYILAHTSAYFDGYKKTIGIGYTHFVHTYFTQI